MSPVQFWLWPIFILKMINLEKIQITTNGEGLYPISDLVKDSLSKLLKNKKSKSGILNLFIMHTSAALMISEDWDKTAKKDLENFLDHLAPRNLPFIQHTLEGTDDSPSHMKSAILHQHLACIVEKGELFLGTWQGIFLAEFRDRPHERCVYLKFSAD